MVAPESSFHNIRQNAQTPAFCMKNAMKRFVLFIVLVLTTALLATDSDALSTVADFKCDQFSGPTTRLSDRPRRLLRTTAETNTDAEERGILGEKGLMKLSKLAEKMGKQKLSKKLEHKAWLAAGESPQSKFREYNWKEKTWEELRQDPTYIRYLGFDELWIKAQEKKGTLYTVDAWIKMAKEEAKKNAAIHNQ